MIAWLGLCAGFLTTIAWLPQLMRVWKTKHANDLSWWYLVVVSTGILLWTIYGILIANAILGITNGIAFLLTVILIFYKTVYSSLTP